MKPVKMLKRYKKLLKMPVTVSNNSELTVNLVKRH